MNERVGLSVLGKPINAFQVARPDRPGALILAGVHGDEPKSVSVARNLVRLLEGDAPAVAEQASWYVIPVVNPDGYEVRKRRNANGVDLNRNFPTRNWEPGSKRSRMFGGAAPASEPETQVVMRVIDRQQPALIVSIHSIDRKRQCNNHDGPGEPLARALSEFNGYPVRGSIGYATPGSLGTWAGVERNIPTVTLELPSHHSLKRCWEDNREALLACATAAKLTSGPSHRHWGG